MPISQVSGHPELREVAHEAGNRSQNLAPEPPPVDPVYFGAQWADNEKQRAYP